MERNERGKDILDSTTREALELSMKIHRNDYDSAYHLAESSGIKRIFRESSGLPLSEWSYDLFTIVDSNNMPLQIELKGEMPTEGSFKKIQKWVFVSETKPMTFDVYDQAETSPIEVRRELRERGITDDDERIDAMRQRIQYNRMVRANLRETEETGSNIATNEEIARGLTVLRELAEGTQR